MGVRRLPFAAYVHSVRHGLPGWVVHGHLPQCVLHLKESECSADAVAESTKLYSVQMINILPTFLSIIQFVTVLLW
jgi:hypothetical protein